MYYGNPNCVDQQNVAGTWSSNYLAVYHLDESAPPYHDSTSHNRDIVATTNTPTQFTAGIGKCQSFDGVNDKLVLPFVPGAIDYSLECLTSQDTFSASQSIWSCDATGTNPAPGISLGYSTTGNSIYAGNNVKKTGITGGVPPVGTTHYYVSQHNIPSNNFLYKDAQLVTTTVSNFFANSVNYNTLGARYSGTSYALFYDGWIDEARVSNTLLSDNWIITTNNVLTNPASITFCGVEETQGGGGGNQYQLTINCGPNGYLTGTQSGMISEGTKVIVYAHPNAGYHFNVWAVTGIANNEQYSPTKVFNMPANAVTLTASFVTPSLTPTPMYADVIGGEIPVGSIKQVEMCLNVPYPPLHCIDSWSFSLSYNPSIVKINSVTSLDFFSGQPTDFNQGTIDNTAGTLTGTSGACINPEDDIAVGGGLVSINFQAIGPGISPVHITASSLSNNGDSMATTLTDGAITVTSGQENLFERFDTGSTGVWKIYGSIDWAQTFTIGTTGSNYNHQITKVSLMGYKTGNPGNVHLSIYSTDAAGNPSQLISEISTQDANTWSTSSAWHDFPIAPISLTAGTKYAIRVGANGGTSVNYLNLRARGSILPPTYLGGAAFKNANGWIPVTGDLYFREYGVQTSDKSQQGGQGGT
jgi:adhesin HecA-like repeat protein